MIVGFYLEENGVNESWMYKTGHYLKPFYLKEKEYEREIQST